MIANLLIVWVGILLMLGIMLYVGHLFRTHKDIFEQATGGARFFYQHYPLFWVAWGILTVVCIRVSISYWRSIPYIYH